LAVAHEELEAAYTEAMADPAFLAELAFYRRDYVGGPTPVAEAKRLTELCGGAHLWLKREDLAHTVMLDVLRVRFTFVIATRDIQTPFPFSSR
jgi:tryptophan synthase beta subunit